MRKPLAVQRREYLTNSGPSIFGITRMDKVVSPNGEIFILLGVREGKIYLEREDKTKGEPFETIDTSAFLSFTKLR